MRKMYFRFHRGGFDESMATKIEIPSLYDLLLILIKHNLEIGRLSCDKKTFNVEYYCYDDRISSDCFIVSFGGYPVGFLWCE